MNFGSVSDKQSENKMDATSEQLEDNFGSVSTPVSSVGKTALILIVEHTQSENASVVDRTPEESGASVECT